MINSARDRNQPAVQTNMKSKKSPSHYYERQSRLMTARESIQVNIAQIQQKEGDHSILMSDGN